MATSIAPQRGLAIPDVGKARAPKLPTVADEILPNGLRVLAARRPGIPMVEARLLIPTARGEAAPAAKLRVAVATLLSGTSARSATEIAEYLQSIGGGLDAVSDEEDVVLVGNSLAPHLAGLLQLMAEVVTDAAHPKDEVQLERDRMVQSITLARSQPETVAREALLKRVFGRHPYGRGMPDPAKVAKVRAGELSDVRSTWLLPAGSTLVLVGDIRPAQAVAMVGEAFVSWKSPKGVAAPGLPKPPPLVTGPIVLVDRPGAVQTSVRMAGTAIDRHHPDYPALSLANLVVGGYFISRLSDNVREKRGYTYGIGTGVQHYNETSLWTLRTDVGTEYTGPALVEIRYELERMLSGPITEAELTSAKRYLGGTLAMAIQTQSGLASYLATLASNDLPLSYLRDYPASVEAIGEAEAIEAARRYLAPAKLVTVLVGDRGEVEPIAAALGGSSGGVEVVTPA